MRGALSQLLITQVSGSKWQVRLIAGPATPQQFSGEFSASSGVNSYSPIKLERGDVVRTTADKSLSITFDAPGRHVRRRRLLDATDGRCRGRLGPGSPAISAYPSPTIRL